MRYTNLIIFFFLFSTSVYSTIIVVIDIEEIIDSNEEYKKIILKIEKDQKDRSRLLQDEEIMLEKLLNNIEASKLLLENSEINKLIDEYNIKLNEFNNNVEKFNFHYQEQIIFIRNKILKQIIVLAEKYAKNNNIDLVLDSNHYLIASNEINITNFIKKELNEIKLNLEFKNFE